MSTDELKQQIIDAITSGRIQATTINIGDHIQHQHNIGTVEAGGVGVQINAPSPHEPADEPQPQPQPAEDITPVENKPEPIQSIIFTKKAKKEGKEPTIIAALQKSIQDRRDKTRAFVEELHTWQKDGYVDAHYNARVMYDELAKLIPLPFGEEVFRKHYNNTRA